MILFVFSVNMPMWRCSIDGGKDLSSNGMFVGIKANKSYRYILKAF